MSAFTNEFAAVSGSVTALVGFSMSSGPVTGRLARTNYPYMAPVTASQGSAQDACDSKPGMAISLSMDSSAMTATFPTDRVNDGLSATEIELRGRFVLGLGGDTAQYRLFLDGLGSHLRAYLSRRLPRAQDDVEDILQETLLAVHN